MEKPEIALQFERFTDADYQILKMIVKKLNKQLPGSGIKINTIKVEGVNKKKEFENREQALLQKNK